MQYIIQLDNLYFHSLSQEQETETYANIHKGFHQQRQGGETIILTNFTALAKKIESKRNLKSYIDLIMNRYESGKIDFSKMTIEVVK
jgi:hypothetical protein